MHYIYIYIMILIAGLACKIKKWIEHEDTRIDDVATQIRNKSNQELKPEDAVKLGTVSTRHTFNT